MSETEGTITASEQDGILVVRLTRSQIFDVETAQQLAAELNELVRAKGGRQWVIDLTGVELIISPVVSALLSALRSERESGGDVALCGMGETVDRVIKLARLDRLFNTYDTLAQALGAVKDARSS